jgi:Flp pilus assembly secretin CpaC
MVEDGGIIVLGGLISDEVREGKSQVPFLGSIPLLGEFFKTRSVDKVKTNLMVFIRPRILRDGIDAAIETNAKYNYIRDQQLRNNKGKVPLMPTERQPTLPALDKMVPPELLNPARQMAPDTATPAERAQASGQNSLPPPVQTPAPVPMPPQATPPPPFTSGVPPTTGTAPQQKTEPTP